MQIQHSSQFVKAQQPHHTGIINGKSTFNGTPLTNYFRTDS